jgi:hypothetical protein
VDAAPLGVRLDTVTARALATIDLAAGTRLTFRLGAGVGVDAVHVTPRSEGSLGTKRAGDEQFALIVGQLGAALSWSMSPVFGLSFMAICDFDPSGSRYVALVGAARTPVLSPWPVRPALALGVTFLRFL